MKTYQQEYDSVLRAMEIHLPPAMVSFIKTLPVFEVVTSSNAPPIDLREMAPTPSDLKLPFERIALIAPDTGLIVGGRTPKGVTGLMTFFDTTSNSVACVGGSFRDQWESKVGVTFGASRHGEALDLGTPNDKMEEGAVQVEQQSRAIYFWFLAAYNSKRNWIVEATPDSARVRRQVAKGKKTPRYLQRTRLLILSQDEMLRRIYPKNSSQAAAVASHIRRGHWRAYQNSRYSDERRAERQWIEPVWVGDKEAVHQGVRYKVRLDL